MQVNAEGTRPSPKLIRQVKPEVLRDRLRKQRRTEQARSYLDQVQSDQIRQWLPRYVSNMRDQRKLKSHVTPLFEQQSSTSGRPSTVQCNKRRRQSHQNNTQTTPTASFQSRNQSIFSVTTNNRTTHSRLGELQLNTIDASQPVKLLLDRNGKCRKDALPPSKFSSKKEADTAIKTHSKPGGQFVPQQKQRQHTPLIRQRQGQSGLNPDLAIKSNRTIVWSDSINGPKTESFLTQIAQHGSFNIGKEQATVNYEELRSSASLVEEKHVESATVQRMEIAESERFLDRQRTQSAKLSAKIALQPSQHSTLQTCVGTQKRVYTPSTVGIPDHLMPQRRQISLDLLLMKRHSLTKTQVKEPEKSFYGPICFKKFEQQLMARRRMMELLHRERQNIIENQERTMLLKNKSIVNLTFLKDQFRDMILKNIVRIQRWFRAKRQGRFFKNLLKNEQLRVRELLVCQLSDMETSITRLKQAIEQRQGQQEEASTRNKVLERIEEAQRQKNQVFKANAVLKFETALTGMIKRSMQTTMLETLSNVSQPIFLTDIVDVMNKVDKEDTDGLGRSLSQTQSEGGQKVEKNQMFQKISASLHQKLLLHINKQKIENFNQKTIVMQNNRASQKPAAQNDQPNFLQVLRSRINQLASQKQEEQKQEASAAAQSTLQATLKAALGQKSKTPDSAMKDSQQRKDSASSRQPSKKRVSIAPRVTIDKLTIKNTNDSVSRGSINTSTLQPVTPVHKQVSKTSVSRHPSFAARPSILSMTNDRNWMPVSRKKSSSKRITKRPSNVQVARPSNAADNNNTSSLFNRPLHSNPKPAKLTFNKQSTVTISNSIMSSGRGSISLGQNLRQDNNMNRRLSQLPRQIDIFKFGLTPMHNIRNNTDDSVDRNNARSRLGSELQIVQDELEPNPSTGIVCQNSRVNTELIQSPQEQLNLQSEEEQQSIEVTFTNKQIKKAIQEKRMSNYEQDLLSDTSSERTISTGKKQELIEVSDVDNSISLSIRTDSSQARRQEKRRQSKMRLNDELPKHLRASQVLRNLTLQSSQDTDFTKQPLMYLNQKLSHRQLRMDACLERRKNILAMMGLDMARRHGLQSARVRPTQAIEDMFLQPMGKNGSFDKSSDSLLDYLNENKVKDFDQERSEDLKASEMSHGTVYEKQDKFISEEAKEYIYRLVGSVKTNKNGQGSMISAPFMEAFPALNDLCSLYSKKKKTKQVVSRKERHRLQRITNKLKDKYREHDEQVMKEQNRGPSVIQKYVDQMFDDLIAQKRFKLIKSINQMRKACGEPPISSYRETDDGDDNSKTQEPSTNQMQLSATDELAKKSKPINIGAGQAEKSAALEADAQDQDSNEKAVMFKNEQKQQNDQIQIRDGSQEQATGTVDDFESERISSEDSKSEKTESINTSVDESKQSINISSSDEDSFGEHGDVMPEDLIDMRPQMFKQEFVEFPDKSYKIFFDLSYQKAPNHIKAFMMSQKQLDQKLQQPVLDKEVQQQVSKKKLSPLAAAAKKRASAIV